MPTVTITHAGRTHYRYVPQDSEEMKDPNGNGVVYLYGGFKSGKFCAIAYKGNAGKSSWHYTFASREKAEEHAREFFASLASWQQKKVEWRAEANKPHTLKPNDIIYNMWGYDQTNIDWYRVTRVSSHFVWLKPIATHVEETGFMSGNSAPRVSESDPAKWGFRDLDEPETKHKAALTRQFGNTVTFKYGAGSKWNGRPMYCSWYA